MERLFRPFQDTDKCFFVLFSQQDFIFVIPDFLAVQQKIVPDLVGVDAVFELVFLNIAGKCAKQQRQCRKALLPVNKHELLRLANRRSQVNIDDRADKMHHAFFIEGDLNNIFPQLVALFGRPAIGALVYRHNKLYRTVHKLLQTGFSGFHYESSKTHALKIIRSIS
jgi:hypothetical protein